MPPVAPYQAHPRRPDDRYPPSPSTGHGGPPAATVTPKRNPAVAAFAVLGVVIAVALVAIIYQVMGGQHSDHPADSGSGGLAPPSHESAATPCSAAPEVSVNAVEMTTAGLAVDTVLSASCSTGDVVTDPRFVLAVTDGTVDVAAGTFDTSAEPIIISPGERTSRTFIFPVGMFWRTADLTSPNAKATAVQGDSSTLRGEVPPAGSSTLSAFAAASPTRGTVDDAALAGLRDLAADDRGAVVDQLENRWVPQVSSKRTGLVAEGIEWTPENILREHLDLRQRYPNVKLVWSADWRTFSGPDWWVTVVGQPFNAAPDALRWCSSNGLDADHCYAKIISRTLSVDGTTVLQK